MDDILNILALSLSVRNISADLFFMLYMLAHFLHRVRHGSERGLRLRPIARLQPTVRVGEHPIRRNVLQHRQQSRLQLAYSGHAGRMDVVNAGADHQRIAEPVEAGQQTQICRECILKVKVQKTKIFMTIPKKVFPIKIIFK